MFADTFLNSKLYHKFIKSIFYFILFFINALIYFLQNELRNYFDFKRYLRMFHLKF